MDILIVHIGRIQPRIGDELVTKRREPILKIIADDVGWHDMLVPAHLDRGFFMPILFRESYQ